MRGWRLIVAAGVAVFVAACESDYGYAPLVLAEERQCDRYVDGIDDLRGQIVRAYDRQDTETYLARLGEIREQCYYLRDYEVRPGERCSTWMLGGGLPSSPARYREAGQVCAEADRMIREIEESAS